MSTARIPFVSLLPEHHRRVRSGHPWVYSNELAMSPETKAIEPGSQWR